MSRIKKNPPINLVLLVSIILLGAFLRLYKLDQIPNGFYVDEAVIGYNAQSILLTGKDEYGKIFPIFLRALETYIPALYTYLTAISISLFGMTIYSVRLLSAVSGIISIFLVFLVLRNINLFKSPLIPYIGAFLFAISPWSIFFSRGAFEANLALAIFTSSIYFFLLSDKNIKYLIPAAIILSISTYAYHAERLIAYIWLPGFLFLASRGRKLHFFLKREVIISVALFAILQIPQLALSTTPAFKLRAVNIFYQEAVEDQAGKTSNFLPSALSIPLAFTREFSSQFTSYFSPRNLFFNPDSDPQRSLPELSVFYPWMFIPYLIGLFLIATRRQEQNIKYVFLLALSAVIPAALTKDPFSSLRALVLILPMIIVIALGIDYLLKSRYKNIWLVCGALLIPISFILLWRSYFVFLPNEGARIWGYGLKQLAEQVQKHPNEKFVIEQTRTPPVYAQLAFFLKYPPEKFQQEINQDIKDNYYTSIFFDPHYIFGNVETRAIKWGTDTCKDLILVGDALAVSPAQAEEHGLEEIFEISDPMDEVVFRGFHTNPYTRCGKSP